MSVGSLLMIWLLVLLATWHDTRAHRDVNLEGPIRPIIFVPGTAGSLLEAKLSKSSPNPDGCTMKRDWYRIWLSISKLLPFNLDCWVENILLHFDPATNTSTTPPGVTVRVPNFGSTVSMEYIDPSWTAYILGNVGAYGKALAHKLLSLGYERDVSIRGAPYDFRFAMSSNPNGYFEKLAALVEETYELNEDKKVVLVSHSLGGLYATWFLNRQPQSWKEKYIDSFIALSTPWAGSTDVLIAMTAGFNFGVSFVKPIRVRKEQRTYETNFLLMPRTEAFPAGKIFVSTDQRNYTASTEDMEALFHDMGWSEGADIYRYVHGVNDPPQVLPPHPGVPTFCIYGKGVSTVEELHFEGKNFPDEQPRLVNVNNGDGTVMYESLSACKNWQLSTEVIELSGVDHQDSLKSNKGIQEIVNILFRSS